MRWDHLGSSAVRRCVVVLAVTGAMAGLGVASASPAKTATDPRVFNLKKKIYGKTAAQWTTEWWQWAYSIPWDQNPIADETGRWTAVAQRGPVWFLGGVYNESGVAVRTATIPTNRALFFPILNSVWWNEPYVPGDNTPIEGLWDALDQSLAEYDVGSLAVTVDGQDVRGVDTMKVLAGPFEFAQPGNGVFAHFTDGQWGAGVRWPAVSGGYWCMLRPLAAGQHTVRLRGRTGTFNLDVTYELTVVEHDRP